MEKFICIPDSFQGTASSLEVCRIMSRKISEVYPDSEVIAIPAADGGEGSVSVFLKVFGGEWVQTEVKDPHFHDVQASYGLVDDGRVAVIEMASCAGIPLAGKTKNPELTTTYGVGQLILDAAQRGAKIIIVGLGDSCTNDGGCGMASALGVQFLDREQKAFIPNGGTLMDIHYIDKTGLAKELSGVEIITMCDIDSPLYGLRGAAHVCASHKGADTEQVAHLDQGLIHLCTRIKEDINLDVANIPGAGAAGGMGAGMAAFLGSKLKIGIEVVLDMVHFNDIARDAKLIMTGEGQLDGESLCGKVVDGVAKRAKALGIPSVAVVGGVGEGMDGIYEKGLTGVFPINRRPQDFSESRFYTEENIAFAVENILRLVRAYGN